MNCTVTIYGLFTCNRPDAVPVRCMCVHEHAEEARACPLCLKCTMYCDACDALGHRCPVGVMVLA